MFWFYQVKWINKQRVLVFSARGVTSRDRHLMNDLRDMMPHSKTESKMERKDPLHIINEVYFPIISSRSKKLQNRFKISHRRLLRWRTATSASSSKDGKRRTCTCGCRTFLKDRAPSSTSKIVLIAFGCGVFHVSFFKSYSLNIVHTMKELKMTGNCLKGTRPLLSFDETFDSKPHWALIKEALTQVLSADWLFDWFVVY